MIYLLFYKEEEPAFVFETFFALQGEEIEASIMREEDQLGNYRVLLDLILSFDWLAFLPPLRPYFKHGIVFESYYALA